MYPQQPYPQQYPPQPQYQPPMPQYPPAQYGAGIYPAYPQPAAAPLPTGTLDDYFEQPSAGGGPSFKFMDANRQPQIGKSYIGVVARPVTNSDVRAQTDQSGRVQTYKDGRPKFVMVVPMNVAQSPEFPESVASWWVKGQARDELARAMAEAGAPAGPPEAGATIRVTLMGVRPVPNMSPAYQYRVEYWRPHTATQPVAQAPAGGPVEQYDNPSTGGRPPMAPTPAAPVQQTPPWAPAVVAPAQYPPQPQYQPAQYPPAAQTAPQVAPVQPAPQTAPVQFTTPPQPGQLAGPGGLSQEQLELYQRLTAGQQPQG